MAADTPSDPNDLAEIDRLITRYNHATDRYDFQGVAECFAPPGLFYGAYGDWLLHEQWPELEAKAKRRAAVAGPTRHFVTSTVTDVVGDTARSRSFLLVTRALPNGSFEVSLTGEYVDELARVDGRWLFTERRVLVDGSGGGDTPAPDPLREVETSDE